MRVDYYHTGDSKSEEFNIDEVSLEGEWPGPAGHRLDRTNLGEYFFELRDAKTETPIYSRGFSSVFGEWKTTAEAQQTRRTFSESLRFPEPGEAFDIHLFRRNEKNEFREVWCVAVDPNGRNVNRAGPPKNLKVWPVIQNGPPRDKVDLLLLGDGYTAAQMEKWHADARRFAEMLFAQRPFSSRRDDFNVWAIDTPAEESGVSIPSQGIWRRSPLRTSYDAFGIERYALATDNKRLREIASAAPYEFVEIIMNERKYGGGGIFNAFATVAADNYASPYVFVHEFGHHFAGLADEYFSSAVAYQKTGESTEPWERNATTDPKASKWADLIPPGTPLPTPWPKQEFEALEKGVQKRRAEIRAKQQDETVMEGLFAEEAKKLDALIDASPYGHTVGAFEGAMYESAGYYRPEENCIMFTRAMKRGFCAVCRRSIDQVIDLYTR